MARKDRRTGHDVAPPRPPAHTAPIDELPGGTLADDGRYADLTLAHATFMGQAARGVTVDQVWFERVRLTGTCLPDVHVLDARFDTCDLAKAAWKKAHLTRVEVRASRLLGLKVVEARLQDVAVIDCDASFALFFGATCVATRFARCTFTEASFQGRTWPVSSSTAATSARQTFGVRRLRRPTCADRAWRGCRLGRRTCGGHRRSGTGPRSSRVCVGSSSDGTRERHLGHERHL